jgi:hypothetical protein
MTVRRVPVNMTFWMPVAKTFGQAWQRMTLCAVRAAIYKEQRVWELTGKEAMEEMWLRQRYR